MTEYKGFRADRLKAVMALNEITVEDVEKYWVEFFKSQGEETEIEDGSFIKMFLEKVLNGYYYEPTLLVLFMICDACNCSADYLLGLSDEIY